MPKPTTLFVALDVHKGFITVAHAEAHRRDPPLFVGLMGSRQGDIDKLVLSVPRINPSPFPDSTPRRRCR
jgi:hypothetical protein